MKTCVCIVHNRDKNKMVDELVQAGFKFTTVCSVGGFLREKNTTFFIGVNEDEIPALRSVIQANCSSREQVVNAAPFDAGPAGSILPMPVKVPVGGAVVFFLPVEGFERY